MSPEAGLAERLAALFHDLPPRTEDRLWQIIAENAVPAGADLPGGSDLLCQRASVVWEQRPGGTGFWRLYIESGSRHSGNLRRRRIYIGREGGPELREAIALLREAYFGKLGEEFGVGPCRDQRELLRKLCAAIEWERDHLYDRYGRYCPDALARSLGYGNQRDQPLSAGPADCIRL